MAWKFFTAAGQEKQIVAPGSGYELSYTEKTSTTSITATTEATANTIITGGAFTSDGTPVMIEFFAPYADPGGATDRITDIVLYLDGVSIGMMAEHRTGGTVAPYHEFSCSRRVTPAAGSRTYSVRAYVNTGTHTIGAGVGTIGAFAPAFLRITKV